MPRLAGHHNNNYREGIAGWFQGYTSSFCVWQWYVCNNDAMICSFSSVPLSFFWWCSHFFVRRRWDDHGATMVDGWRGSVVPIWYLTGSRVRCPGSSIRARRYLARELNVRWIEFQKWHSFVLCHVETYTARIRRTSSTNGTNHKKSGRRPSQNDTPFQQTANTTQQQQPNGATHIYI